MSTNKGKMPLIDASHYRFAIVASRYNKKYVDALVRDAVKSLSGHGVDAENIRLVRVPGAGEIPYVCNMLAETDEYDAVIALGVVIAGETPHHEIIAHSTANALQQASMISTVPIVNGIVAANDEEQAKARTVGKIARGEEFAECAMEMAWHAAILLDELADADERHDAEFKKGGK